MNEINASFSALQVKNLDELKNVMPVGQKFPVKDGTQIKNELIKEKLTFATKEILKFDAIAKINDLRVIWQRKDDETRNVINQTSDLSVSIFEQGISYDLYSGHRLSGDRNSYEVGMFSGTSANVGLFVRKNEGYFTSLKSKNLGNLTEEAYSNTLQTPYGDVKVFFDLYADNDKLGIGELENNKKLFNFD
ncbi:hypothetical protein NYG85_11865, partial [Campylobacter sp. PS10]|nr:hypothetical protein [Campylobacter gastrosuis]